MKFCISAKHPTLGFCTWLLFWLRFSLAPTHNFSSPFAARFLKNLSRPVRRFIVGFFFPICWWIAVCMYIRHPHPSARRAGIASLIAAIVNLVLCIILFIVFFATVRVRYY